MHADTYRRHKRDIFQDATTGLQCCKENRYFSRTMIHTVWNVTSWHGDRHTFFWRHVCWRHRERGIRWRHRRRRSRGDCNSSTPKQRLLTFYLPVHRPTSVATSRNCIFVCFYRAMLCIRGTSHGPVSVSVCLSVSVTSRSSIKTAKHRITQTKAHDTLGTLAFCCQRSPRNSTGVTP